MNKCISKETVLREFPVVIARNKCLQSFSEFYSKIKETRLIVSSTTLKCL